MAVHDRIRLIDRLKRGPRSRGPRHVQGLRGCVKRADNRADARTVGERIFARRRGFTPLTVLVAAVDLAAVVVGALLWWVADAERHGEDMPWLFGGLVAFALLAVLDWAYSGGRRRISLALGSVLLVAAAYAAFFG